MQHVTLAKGLPASGKSSWAKDFVKNNESWKRINRDELRLLIDGGEWSPQRERFIVEARNTLLEAALKKGFNVIIDDTNLRNENWEDVNEIVERLNIDCMVTEKCFPIDVDVAIERDSKREGKACVGANVIRNMWKKNIFGKPETMRPRATHHYSKTAPGLEQDETLPKAVICDLDGTLAIIGDRSPYNASKCDEVDTPNTPVLETIRMFHNNGYKILFVSGREDKDRDPSMRFIAKHLPEVCGEWFHMNVNRLTAAYTRLTFSKNDEREMLELELDELTKLMLEKLKNDSPGCKLFMRSTDDKRKDTIVKKEIFEREIRGKYNVLVAIDDRPCVVRTWRYDVGIPVFAVNDKEF